MRERETDKKRKTNREEGGRRLYGYLEKEVRRKRERSGRCICYGEP